MRELEGASEGVLIEEVGIPRARVVSLVIVTVVLAGILVVWSSKPRESTTVPGPAGIVREVGGGVD